jgi:lauroyl/myristoyl acyltransferase
MTNTTAVTVPSDLTLARRAYATPALHRLAPWPLALATVRARARRLWAQPAKREHALRSMEYLVGASSRAHEVEAIAERYVFENVKRDELTWRPWQTTRFPVDGAGILRELAASGRGAIVNFLHHGQYAGTFGSLGRHGVHLHLAVNPGLLGPQPPTYEGRRGTRHIRTARVGTASVFSANGGLDRMRELLADGELVALASDLPGSMPMDLLGRRVSAGSGAARLSLETGAPIVAVTAWRDGSLQRLRVEAPIDPVDHTDVASVQQAIADAHAPALLAWPEALMEPLERWAAESTDGAERRVPAPT